jgi:lysozyme family protein
MPEVFSISGWGDTITQACPVGWATTPNGNCTGPDAAPLQRALAALGNTVGDTSLSSISIDGVIGPGTTAAVNRAFTVHIGPGQAAARFRTGALTQAQVANEAALETSVILAEVTRRGGAVVVAKTPISTPSSSYAPPKPPAVATTVYVPPSPGYTTSTPSYSPPASGSSSIAMWSLAGLGLVAVAAGIYYTFYASADQT